MSNKRLHSSLISLHVKRTSAQTHQYHAVTIMLLELATSMLHCTPMEQCLPQQGALH